MDVLTIEQASEESGLSGRTLRRYCLDGRIKARKIGPSWVIEPDDLKAFLRQPRKVGRPPKEGE